MSRISKHVFTSGVKSGSMSSMKVRFGNKRGGASLLTTVILAVLLIGIVGGLTTLSINELRQASNTEQSSRALAAAEAGVQQLADQIDVETGPHERLACNADPSSPTVVADAKRFATNSFITCATVKAGDSDTTEGKIDRDQSYKLDVSRAYKKGDVTRTPAPVTAMSIAWDNVPTLSSSLNPGIIYPALADSNNWGSPAALELTYVWWNPAGGSIPVIAANPAMDYGLDMKKVVFKPGQNTAGTPNNTCGSTVAVPGTTIPTYRCTTLSGPGVVPSQESGRRFDISTVLGAGVSAQSMVFKLTARYNSANFRLKFYSGADELMVPQPYAIIDVTAKSNNLYRRVIAQKPLTSDAPIDYLDNVVFSGKNICKDMKVDVSHGVPQYVGGGAAGDGKNSASCEN